MIWRVVGAGLIMAVICALLSEMGFRSKRVFAALCIVILLSSALGGVGEIVGKIVGLSESGEAKEVCRIALKVVGIGYVFGFVSDVAEELGERGIAGAVTAVGRIEIVVLVMPYFIEICSLAELFLT